MISLLPLHPAATLDEARYRVIPLAACKGEERSIPTEWLLPHARSPVAEAFTQYLRPIVGALPPYAAPLAERLKLNLTRSKVATS